MALMSIAGYWAFYYVIVTARAFIAERGDLDDKFKDLGPRAVVTIVSIGVSIVFYRLLRTAPKATQARAIVLAALIAIPAALIYATTNWYVFEYSQSKAAHVQAAPIVDRSVAADSIGHMPRAPAMRSGSRRHHDTSVWQVIAEDAPNGYFYFVGLAALFLALRYGAEVASLERHAAALRASAQAAELRALRYQINPHFLFNTLNSLSTLVLAGRQTEAEQMIINLSTFFRTSLRGDPTEDVPLSEEIRLQRLYLDIEAVRFPTRLIALFDIPETLEDVPVPGLILQPLVENAVKFGVARSRRTVTVRIAANETADRLRLTVTDDGEGARAEDRDLGGAGVGLANVRNRLLARYGEDASLHWHVRPNGGFSVEIILPAQTPGVGP